MSWDSVFLLANYWAIGGWLLLAFAPRGPKVLALILYAGVFLLCLAYAVMLGGFLSGTIDAGGTGGAAAGTTGGGVARRAERSAACFSIRQLVALTRTARAPVPSSICRIASGMSALTRWCPVVATVSPSTRGRRAKVRLSASAEP